MTLDKAKEILTLFANGYYSQSSPDLRDAARLGSEALILIEKQRKYSLAFHDELLSGEIERRENE